MSVSDSFPKLAALADAKFSYRDELGRECRAALDTIDRLEAQVAWMEVGMRNRDVLAELRRTSLCTPAERALIDAALAWRACFPCPLEQLNAIGLAETTLYTAADAVLVERGEA